FPTRRSSDLILVVKGANDLLAPGDVDAAEPLLRKANAIVLQFEIPLRTVYHTAQFAKRKGIRCIVNPAPAQPVDFAQLGGVDYFMPNESEAETVHAAELRNVHGLRWRGIHDTPDPLAFCELRRVI